MNRSNSRRPVWCVIGCAMVAAMIGAASSDAESIAERRERIASLPQEQKRELLDRKSRFEELSSEEQARLRRLYAAIHEHPKRQQLLEVLRNYHRWLAMLPPTERAELLSLSRDERLKKIEERVREEERQRFLELSDKQLTPADHDAIHSWLRDVIEERMDQVLARIPQLRGLDPPRRFRFLMFGVIGAEKTPDGKPNLMRPTDEELRALAKTLCPRAQQFLNKLDSGETRREVLTKWIRTAVQTRLIPPIDPAKLIDFMKELSPDERSRLEALPRQEMLDELRRMYLRSRWRSERPGGFPGDGRRGGRGRPRPHGPGDDRPGER